MNGIFQIGIMLMLFVIILMLAFIGTDVSFILKYLQDFS